MHIPQIVMIVLISFSVFKALSHFGEVKKQDTYDWVDLILAPAINVGILWWGGFWG